MINGFVQGIWDAWGHLEYWVRQVAQMISDVLGFSVPDEGPLSDADKYMPDFIDLMAHGLEKSAPKLYRAASNVAAGIQSAMNPNLALNASVGNMADIQNQLAIPVSASMPQQNITQIHEHFEVKPGVMIASDSEQREFVRHVEKLMGMEDIRTNYD
jgi:hypothetical protein